MPINLVFSKIQRRMEFFITILREVNSPKLPPFMAKQNSSEMICESAHLIIYFQGMQNFQVNYFTGVGYTALSMFSPSSSFLFPLFTSLAAFIEQ